MLRILSRRAAALAFPMMMAICLPPMVVIALNLRAQSTSASSQPNSSSSGNSTTTANSTNSAASTDSAAAKTAARKKAFEADLQGLEDGGSFHHQGSGPQTLFVSPDVVNMIRGQRADFGAFDNKGHDVSSRAEWSLSNSYVATLVTGKGRPYLIAKTPGEVTVRARIDENESSCDVTVYDGTALPAGTPAYIAAKIPGLKAVQAAPASPAAKPRPAPSTATHPM
ncbi:MAG TPA: hypothetical protein VNK23_02410 [Candidatus Dormibacteraeota bacterium]|nr:hypothetical protein [Candidatus Dormibacteraeota bacterium]